MLVVDEHGSDRMRSRFFLGGMPACIAEEWKALRTNRLAALRREAAVSAVRRTQPRFDAGDERTMHLPGAIWPDSTLSCLIYYILFASTEAIARSVLDGYKRCVDVWTGGQTQLLNKGPDGLDMSLGHLSRHGLWTVTGRDASQRVLHVLSTG